MKVKELIEKLQTFDPEILVMVDGYEGGLSDAKDPVECKVVLDYHEHSYYGKHEYHHVTDNTRADCSAVIIRRD